MRRERSSRWLVFLCLLGLVGIFLGIDRCISSTRPIESDSQTPSSNAQDEVTPPPHPVEPMTHQVRAPRSAFLVVDAGSQPRPIVSPTATAPTDAGAFAVAVALLEGTVHRRDGGLPGKSVRIEALGTDDDVTAGFGHTMSDSTGHFWLQLTPGSYALSAFTDKRPSWGQMQAQKVLLKAGEVTRVDLPVMDEGLATVHGRVLAHDGTPIVDAEADIDVRDDNRWDGFSEKNGSFVLERVEPGVHVLLINKDGFVSKRLFIDLDPGEDLDFGDIVLERR
jgi:hypothetical protein